VGFEDAAYETCWPETDILLISTVCRLAETKVQTFYRICLTPRSAILDRLSGRWTPAACERSHGGFTGHACGFRERSVSAVTVAGPGSPVIQFAALRLGHQPATFRLMVKAVARLRIESRLQDRGRLAIAAKQIAQNVRPFGIVTCKELLALSLAKRRYRRHLRNCLAKRRKPNHLGMPRRRGVLNRFMFRQREEQTARQFPNGRAQKRFHFFTGWKNAYARCRPAQPSAVALGRCHDSLPSNGSE